MTQDKDEQPQHALGDREASASTDRAALYQEAFRLLAKAEQLLDATAERLEARFSTLLSEIDARFVSGNSVPVERASIRASEWAVIRQYLNASREEGRKMQTEASPAPTYHSQREKPRPSGRGWIALFSQFPTNHSGNCPA